MNVAGVQDPFSFPIDERESGSYLATLTDDLGAVLPGSSLLTLQLSLYVVNSAGVVVYINDRNHENALNVNEVTVYDTLQTLSDGRTYNLRWRVQPADSAIIEAGLQFERHIGLFEWTWASGAGKHEFVLVVKNLLAVT